MSRPTTTHIHIPTGKACRLLYRQGQRCFCDFGPITNPFCWVDYKELAEYKLGGYRKARYGCAA